ncbi:MAG: ribonuclease Y [Acidobacteriota bacterium]|nr:ribonuclease Y [Acidobacteriota bacterium]
MSESLSLIITGLAAAFIGGFFGWLLNNRFGVRSLAATKMRTDEQLRSARRASEKLRRRVELEAKESILGQKEKFDRDLRSRKGQLAKRERDISAAQQGLQDTEGQLKREEEKLTQRQAAMNDLEAAAQGKLEEAERTFDEQTDKLASVSGMTREEARRQLLANLKVQARLDAVTMVKEIRDEARKGADAEAQRILAMAVERAASDFSSERTISMFDLPEGSDLKGRIIGQEGKNIRAFEAATGIQLLIDEEANKITLSGYNPVKREIARRVLTTLVKDGHIHPKRIDDLTKRNTRRLDDEMRKAGQETVKELKLKKVHPEIVKLLGRLRYRTSYGQNVLNHSKEVAYLTGMLAAELRLDEREARRAGLLHDIGKAIDYEREGTHPEIGAEVATQCGESDAVVNAIASHHEDCEMTTPISVLVSAADSLSGARPGARRKTVAEYIKRIEKLEELANDMKGVDQSYAIQAGREIRVIAKSRQTDDAQVEMIASDLAGKIQSEMDYPGKVKVTVIRELRAVEHAR